jgi:predicted glutamine amidotransferase
MKQEADTVIVSSEKLHGYTDWHLIPNNSLMELKCF